MFCLRIFLLLFLVSGTLAQELNLFDALDDTAKPTEKPKEKPKDPEKPKDNGEFGLDLGDAVDDSAKPTEKPKGKPKDPKKTEFDGFNLDDALGDLDPKPDNRDKSVNPPNSGGGDGKPLDDLDLILDGYKPDGGRSAGGGGQDPGYDPHGGAADQPQDPATAGSGQIAGIASAIGVALLGAASSYFAYQKKKLCFKMQGGADPERGKTHQGNQSDGLQVLSNLLRTS